MLLMTQHNLLLEWRHIASSHRGDTLNLIRNSN